MRSVTKLLAGTILALAAVGCGGWLRQPGEDVEAALLRETPVSTSKDAVRRAAIEGGRPILEEGEIRPNESNYPVPSSEGVSYLRVHLGSYGLIFSVDVSAFYIFNAKNELSVVHVRKETDAP